MTRPALSALSAVAACFLLLSCGTPESDSGNGEGAQAQAVKTKAKRVGIYAFDGTNNIPAHKTVITRLLSDARAPVKRYFAGTDLIASTHRDIVERGIAAICADNKVSPLDTVMLVGYSRGAIAAYETAARLKTACGKPVLVRWIGLFDAVATSIEDSLAIGTSGRDSIGTRCFHVVKTHEKLPFLGTAPILSCQAKEIRADHIALGQSDNAVALLRADANTVVPGIFADTTRTLAATSGPTGKCSVNSDLRSCFKAGCSWNEARCEVARK